MTGQTNPTRPLVPLLAQVLHDIGNPRETNLRFGSLYQVMAEQIAAEVMNDGTVLLDWLSERRLLGLPKTY